VTDRGFTPPWNFMPGRAPFGESVGYQGHIVLRADTIAVFGYAGRFPLSHRPLHGETASGLPRRVPRISRGKNGRAQFDGKPRFMSTRIPGAARIRLEAVIFDYAVRGE